LTDASISAIEGHAEILHDTGTLQGRNPESFSIFGVIVVKRKRHSLLCLMRKLAAKINTRTTWTACGIPQLFTNMSAVCQCESA